MVLWWLIIKLSSVTLSHEESHLVSVGFAKLIYNLKDDGKGVTKVCGKLNFGLRKVRLLIFESLTLE